MVKLRDESLENLAGEEQRITPLQQMITRDATMPKARFLKVLRTNHGTFRGWMRVVLGQLELISGRVEDFAHPDLGRVRRLVFVCLGNINRSAFAEQVARKLGARACSVGLSTKNRHSGVCQGGCTGANLRR
ncbi:MAG: hypothetical protein MZV65_28030 [Chromatiales bacterium]|nr:hypothetical protein [Chromatiales bacterium]